MYVSTHEELSAGRVRIIMRNCIGSKHEQYWLDVVEQWIDDARCIVDVPIASEEQFMKACWDNGLSRDTTARIERINGTLAGVMLMAVGTVAGMNGAVAFQDLITEYVTYMLATGNWH